MHQLIIPALQKGRIYRAKRLHAARRQGRRKSHGMLFSDTYIETALGKKLGKQIQSRPIRHGRSDCTYFIVPSSKIGQSLGKDLGISRRVRGSLLLFAGRDVKFSRCMAFVWRSLSRTIALALLGYYMNEVRPDSALLNHAQNWQKLVHIMAINWPDIGKPKLFKQRTPNGKPLEQPLGLFGNIAHAFRQKAQRDLRDGL